MQHQRKYLVLSSADNSLHLRLGMAPESALELHTNSELIYRGEGNSSLVIALTTKKKVIRLLKTDAKKLKNDKDVLAHLLQHIDFNVNILPNVLPNHFFSPPQLIRLDSAQVELIKNLIKDKRPAFRLDKTISNNSDYALLMNDYCCIPKTLSSRVNVVGPVISIEIKPKQGFLPKPELLISEVLKFKSNICRYGLAQFYKLQKNSIKSISSYCPLDLFSGCPYRALYSLACLIESPQNNFRVFCDARLVYDENSRDKFNFKELFSITENLFDFNFPKNGTPSKAKKTNNFDKLSNGMAKTDAISRFCFLLLQALFKPYSSGTSNTLLLNQEDKTIHNYKLDKNVLREASKLDFTNDYVYYRTFINLFEGMLKNCSSNELNPANDINNNVKVQECPTQNVENLSDNQFEVTQKLCKILKEYETQDVNGNLIETDNPTQLTTSCWLHKNKRLCTNQLVNCNQKCRCSDSRHSLPSGCVLDSILQAQQLDNIDSENAYATLQKLFFNYKQLKQQCPLDFYMDKNEYHCFIETFLLENRNDLDELWRFLVSLTAKDCSIMIAIQRLECDSPLPSLPWNVIVDKSSGQRFVVSVSITDLDYKQACKIQRTLHNDNRMIAAFLSAFASDPSLTRFSKLDAF